MCGETRDSLSHPHPVSEPANKLIVDYLFILSLIVGNNFSYELIELTYKMNIWLNRINVGYSLRLRSTLFFNN